MSLYPAIHATSALVMAVVFAGSMAVTGGQVMAAAAKPALQVSPRSVPIGGRATLTGQHLGRTRFLVVLFTAGSGKNVTQRFLGLARVDASGNMHVPIHIPVVTQCGPASIMVFASKSSIMARASFTLTGCKAGKGSIAPPPPPGSPKKKKP